MKKIYIEPSIDIIEIDLEKILASSDSGVFNDELEIEYGGVDINGMDAESKTIENSWGEWE